MNKFIGILPMAGRAIRIQPIAFSKELYPVLYKNKHLVISEFSVRAMFKAGVSEVRMVIHPDKQDIVKYYSTNKNNLAFYFYTSPSLPDSCLYPIESLHDDDFCLFGLPDTIFSDPDGFLKIRQHLETGSDICLGLFRVPDASLFDSIKTDSRGKVLQVAVKKKPSLSNRVWGIWGARVNILKKLKKIILKQNSRNEKLLGVGFNVLTKDPEINFTSVYLGNKYYDIGTFSALKNLHEITNTFILE